MQEAVGKRPTHLPSNWAPLTINMIGKLCSSNFEATLADRMTSKLKRRHVDSSSPSTSSSDDDFPSIDGTVVRRGKKRRAQRRLDHSLKELKEEMTRMKNEITESLEGLQRNVTEQFNELKDAILLLRPSPTSWKEENIRNLKLQCKTKLAQRVYTESKLAGDQGTGIQIILIDADTNQIITTGIKSSLKVHAVVLEGDFNREDHENWPREEFDGHIVKERSQKRPLLIGDLQVTLKEGAGSLNNLTFTDNSSRHPSRTFRIGVQVASGYYEGTRIREALTEPFSVLEHRGELSMKHHPPESSDYVWRLDCIGKDGRFQTRLSEEGINNVEEFLQAYNKDQQALRNILGKQMSTTKWNSLIRHAKTCPPNGKFFVFYPNAERNYGLLFDNFACLAGRLLNGVPQLINSMSDSEKREMDNLVKIAHQNWKDVTEYTGLHGLDPDIERSIIPHPAATMLFENHHEIPPGCSFNLPNFPIQISLPVANHLESSAWPSPDLASFHNVNASSTMAAEQASTSQQLPVQAGETSTPHQPVQYTSSNLFASSEPLNVDDYLTNSPGDSFNENICISDFAIIHNNLPSRSSFDSVPAVPDFISGKGKAIISWFMVKAVLKWGFISKKRSGAMLIEL